MRLNSNKAPKVITAVLLAAFAAFTTYSQQHNNPKPVQHQPVPTHAAAASPELTTAKCHMVGKLPDPVCTPGSIDPNVTDANVSSTICKSGYTASIRPSSGYTGKLKRQQMAEYGFTDASSAHEEDHLISLELGGAAADPTNLWPEPGASPNEKDAIENHLRTAVCAGRISLSDAQHRIATDWTTAEQGLHN